MSIEKAKELYEVLTNGVGEKPYYRIENGQINIYVADDQLFCIVPMELGIEGKIAKEIAEAICEAGTTIQALAELSEKPEPTEFTKYSQFVIVGGRTAAENPAYAIIPEIEFVLIDHDKALSIEDAKYIMSMQTEIDRLKAKPRENCPECGKPNVEIFVDRINFGTMDVCGPIWKCNDCDFKWINHISEEVYEKNKAIINQALKENK